MKDTLRLARDDLRRAFSTVMSGIVMFGLLVIPSLFTWFNVIASWDPFSETDNLTVAVASSDEGYQSDLVPLRINVGEQVLSALRANDQLNWVITTPEDAVDGTESGEYYAAIVLPADFSADMLTFYSDGGQRTSIAYYTNEKKNALAPKITGQGAEGVSTQISRVFNETLSEIGLSLVASLSDYLTSDETQAALTRLEARVSGVAGQLRSGAQTASMFDALLATSIPLVDGASSLVSSTASAFENTGDTVGQGVDAVGDLSTTLQTAASALTTGLSNTASGYAAVGEQVDALFARVDDLSASQADVLSTVAERVQNQIDQSTAVRDALESTVRPTLPEAAQPALDAVIADLDTVIGRQQSMHDRLTEAVTDVETGNQNAQSSHDEITAAIEDARAAITDAQASYDEGLRPQLDELSATLSQIGAGIGTITDDLSSAARRLTDGDGSVEETLAGARTTTQGISSSLEETASTFDDLETALSRAIDTGNLDQLRDVIGSDAGALASALADPVKLDRVAVYPIVSFGAGMTPLYTALALWVGALLATVAVRTQVPDRPLPGTELSPTQAYLGRYGIFALISLGQSTLLILGLIAFVRIEPAHPWLLLLAGWLTSLVFSLVVYTLVVAFGNAGKALSILLLVIQISGSGGAYPLPLLPQWFQNISPFLPATHAIDAMRAAIAGVYRGDFAAACGMLALFIVPALLLGVVLSRQLRSFNRSLVSALESTKVM